MGSKLKKIQLGSRGVTGRSRPILNSEINVTPFVDVMLVLLVIFMVTSPMLISGVEVDLPKTKSGPLAGNDEPLVISIDKSGFFYIEQKKMDIDQLKSNLAAVLTAKADTRVFVRGDQSINYGKVLELFSLVKEIGFNNVALVTESIQPKTDK